MYSKLREEQILRKIAKLLYIFLTTPNELKNMLRFWLIQMTMVYSTIILRFCFFLCKTTTNKQKYDQKTTWKIVDLKKFKIRAILTLAYQKRNDRKIFESNAKLIASISDID